MKNIKFIFITICLAVALQGITVAMQARSQVQRMVDQLSLTQDQKAKLDPILEEDAKNVRALRNDAKLSTEERKKKTAEIRKDTDAKMKPILTADQWKKLQDLREERKKDTTKKKS